MLLRRPNLIHVNTMLEVYIGQYYTLDFLCLA